MPTVLAVEIENPRSVYTCGDRIRGIVHVRTDRPISINSLHVQLLCKVSTRTRGLDQAASPRIADYESTSFPYCFVRRLVSEPRIASSHLDLSFEFTLPAETKRNEIEPAWRPSETFEHLADHALPPTWTGDHQLRGQAVHFVEAIMFASKRYEEKYVAKQCFEFSPCRAAENPDARCTRMVRTIRSKIPKSLVSTPELPPRRKSLIDILTIEEKLSLNFQIEVLCPTVLYSGGLIPVSVAVHPGQAPGQTQPRQSGCEYTPPDSPMMSPVDTVVKMPLTFVDGVYTYLEANTDRRIREGSERSAREHALLMSDMAQICNVLDRPIAVSQMQDRLTALHPHFPELRLRPETTPTFRSFSLRRRYVLHLRIRVVIGDQEHAVDLAHPVLILPGICRNTAGAIRDTGDLMPGLRRRVSEETLPPYEVVDPRPSDLNDPLPLIW